MEVDHHKHFAEKLTSDQEDVNMVDCNKIQDAPALTQSHEYKPDQVQ